MSSRGMKNNFQFRFMVNFDTSEIALTIQNYLKVQVSFCQISLRPTSEEITEHEFVGNGNDR